MMGNYVQLHRPLETGGHKTDRGEGWYREQLLLPCAVTGCTIPFVMEKGHPLSLSISRMDVRQTGQPYDQRVSHRPENTRGAYCVCPSGLNATEDTPLVCP